MSAEFTFVIPKRYWMTSNGRYHWADKMERTRHLRRMGLTVGQMHGTGFDQLVRIVAHIGYPTSGRADPNNAEPTVKPLIDGLTSAGVFIDDDSTHVIGPDFRRDDTRAERGTHTVRLVVEEVGRG